MSADAGVEASEQELAWFFADSSAAIGFRGQNIDAGGGDSVFDEDASHRLHMHYRKPRHRRAADMLRRVGSTVAAMSPESKRVARLAYTPHAWPAPLRVLFMGRRGVCLVSVALTTREAADQRSKSVSPCASVLDWLVFEANRCLEMNRTPARIVAIRNEATAKLSSALNEYHSLRMRRVQSDRQQRDAYIRGDI